MKAVVAALLAFALVAISAASQSNTSEAGKTKLTKKTRRQAKVVESTDAALSKEDTDAKKSSSSSSASSTEVADNKPKTKSVESNEDDQTASGSKTETDKGKKLETKSARKSLISGACCGRIMQVCTYGSIAIVVLAVGTALLCKSFPESALTAITENQFCVASTSVSGAIARLTGSGWEPLVDEKLAAAGLQSSQYYAAQVMGQCQAFLGQTSRFCKC